MTRVYCDICHGVLIPDKTYTMSVSTSEYDPEKNTDDRMVVESYNHYDLCKECAKKFNKFWNNISGE